MPFSSAAICILTSLLHRLTGSFLIPYPIYSLPVLYTFFLPYLGSSWSVARTAFTASVPTHLAFVVAYLPHLTLTTHATPFLPYLCGFCCIPTPSTAVTMPLATLLPPPGALFVVVVLPSHLLQHTPFWMFAFTVVYFSCATCCYPALASLT